MLTSITGRQLKAARNLLGLSQPDLARLSGVSYATIGHYERCGGVEVSGRVATLSKLIVVLEGGGIAFVDGGAWADEEFPRRVHAYSATAAESTRGGE